MSGGTSMRCKSALSCLMLMLIVTSTSSQVLAQRDHQETFKRHSIGGSLFTLVNFTEDGADYYLLNYGYQLTQNDILFAEAWTWKYSEPLGTYGDSEEMYQGKIRAYGMGVGYQRFLWKRFFTTLEATPLILQYFDTDNNKIQKGLQLYCQVIAGYRFEFFDKRWFVEPAYALKYWPLNTNVPPSFADIDEGTPKYTFEPSLNFGFKF